MMEFKKRLQYFEETPVGSKVILCIFTFNKTTKICFGRQMIENNVKKL